MRQVIFIAVLVWFTLANFASAQTITIVCGTIGTVNCQNVPTSDCGWYSCFSDSECEGIYQYVQYPDRTYNSHTDVLPGDPGYQTLTFTVPSTVCTTRRACSKCMARIGSGFDDEFCTSASTDPWQNDVVKANFFLSNPCTGS